MCGSLIARGLGAFNSPELRILLFLLLRGDQLSLARDLIGGLTQYLQSLRRSTRLLTPISMAEGINQFLLMRGLINTDEHTHTHTYNNAIG